MGRLKNLAKNSPAGARMSATQNYGEVATVGLSFVFSLVIGTVIGWWLDSRYGWKPYGFLGGLALGLGAGIRSVYVILKPIVSPHPSALPAPAPDHDHSQNPDDDRP